MRLIKGSFKLMTPKDITDDTKRESMVRLGLRSEIIGSLILLLIGLGILTDKNIYDIPVFYENAFTLIGLACFLVILVVSSKAEQYDLKPKDEYEQQVSQRIYSKGYDLFRWSLMFLFIFNEAIVKISLVGVLLVTLGGVSLITAWRRYANAGANA